MDDEKMVIAGSVMSDVGCVRTVNEDRAVLIEGSCRADSRGWLAIVADGMGGHSAGEVASQLTVDTVAHLFSWQAEDPTEALVDAVRQANREVFTTAGEQEDLTGMGTTCTAVVLVDWRAHLAHVGDSRLYLVRAGKIYRLTEDDSSVMEMVRRGVITLDEAKDHRDRNVILRALGTKPELEPTSWEYPLPLEAGDLVILSSDGLHDLVDDDEILRIVIAEGHRDACSHLVDLARLRGGPDNISMVVLAVDRKSGRRPTTKSTRSMEVPQL